MANKLAHASEAVRARNPELFNEKERTSCLKLVLPYPPTVNHMYFERVAFTKAGRAFVQKGKTKAAQEYFKEVALIWLRERKQPFAHHQKLSLSIVMNAPDNRSRDLDNIVKAAQDALAEAGIFPNDAQIDELTIRRGEVMPPNGQIIVMLDVLPGQESLF